MRMSSELDKSQHILPLDQPIVTLEVASAFKGLTDTEKRYAHHISQASWTGGLITFLQTSPESGPIFVLLHKLFSGLKPQDFKKVALQAGFSEDEAKAFLVYACGIFSNAGNYKGFGDSKFVPGIAQDRLESLLAATPVWPKIKELWAKVKNAMYDLSPGKTCLGYAPHGCTTYLSKNCTPEDNQRVQDWMKTQNIEGYNTRLFKTVLPDGKIDYEIRLASKETGEISKETYGNMTFRLTKGDYSPIIGKVAESLEEASKYAANPTQAKMLKAYAQSFITGSLDLHKDGSRHWIKDKGPAVETYIGFIETYRDPAGIRGEFEGFVAIVNRAMSAKFTTLVSKAEEFLPLLPWPKGFEKDKFLRPDFTSLDVLTFASSGIPAGINIPNYDDIRQSEGFKNVSLGNVIPASYQMSVIPFLNESDTQLIQKYRVASFELQVGLHELLGHGSGKIFYRAADGTFNYPNTLLDPLTGKPPSTYYEPGDTYDSRFGPMSSSYEECRAEAVGLYLSLEPAVLQIFGHKGQEAEDVLYVNWLSLVWNGIGRALETWDPKRGWLQAHSQARFVLARVLIQAGVASVTQPSDGDLLVTLDRAALKGAGRSAIAHFLLQLQVYKATANIEAAQNLYQHYSEVCEPWLSWRAIVLANKQPRKIFAQANTVLSSNVELKTYGETPEGMIQSWTERFPNPEPLYQALIDLSASNEHYFI
nr:PREDICTED: dipeptidyl peptidase 3 [Tribolium castaneum]|eukprot:XP_008196345.1 PREDICTED: dipeptidyl peptidase 3 [Tribolium castaneum]